MHYLVRKLWLLGLVLSLVCGAALSSEVAPADARKIKTLIEAQIAAFASDDATKAFSYAAPGIRIASGTPERFMEMVRANYPVVYRPTSVNFLSTGSIDGQVFQAVQMTDGDGHVWLALYALERQLDKSWRISGCVVHKGEGQVV